MMTLDEAIRHAEEVAAGHDKIKQIKVVTLEECKRADEHRQLAEWLKELKRLKKQEKDKSYTLWKESYEVERQRSIRLEEKIKALEKEPCEDAVRRSDVITLIMNLNYKYLFNIVRGISQKAFEDLLNETQALPSVTPTVHAIPVCKIKQAREKMESRRYVEEETTGLAWHDLGVEMCLEILDELIESEG